MDPTWEEHEVATTPKRYMNLLDGNIPGQALGLGASDAMMALFSCFFLVFPRQPVPFVFAKLNITWTFLPKSAQERLPIIGRWLGRTRLAAIWVLPMFFVLDFQEIWR